MMLGRNERGLARRTGMKTFHQVLLFTGWMFWVQPLLAEETSNGGMRTRTGLQVLYAFDSIEGNILRDSSGNPEPVDLQIFDAKSLRQSAEGLEILGPTLLQSANPPRRLLKAIEEAGGMTIEAWILPANRQQTGPARIVTFSKNSSERNFTLGQDKDAFEVRVRTPKTSTNGLPGISAKASSRPSTDWTHVVYTCNRQGQAKLFLNGTLEQELALGAGPSNWDATLLLGVGNELSRDRPWLGRLRLLAIYSRALAPEEIARNFQAGRELNPPSPKELLARSQRDNALLFETRIAPLLSRHCLECHDAATQVGGLDLSRKSKSLPPAKQKAVWIAGDTRKSLLWQLVANNEMPRDRPPLSEADKQSLREWIDGGAVWSLDVIDPAVYQHGSGSDKVYLQRLTVPEYIETVRATLGVEIAEEAERLLPRDVRADGFSNTAYNLTVDLAHVEAYARLAEIVVGRTDVQALSRKYTKSRELTDENITKVIKPLGRQLLRGPVHSDEITWYCGVSTSVAGAGGSFEEAIGYVLEAMLQSPRFLYRIEHHAGTGEARTLNAFELASRLSYALWGAPPDEALLQAAEREELDRAGVARQVQRMLQDPRAAARSRQFLSEWLNLSGLSTLRPDEKKFPDWNPALARDMQQETLACFDEIVWKQQLPLSQLLHASFTYVTPRLARHYGLPMTSALKQARDDELVRYDLTDVPSRGGLLTQGSVLTKGGDEASMVTRGLFLLHELLRGVVRDPPPCVDTSPIPSQPGLTQRLVSERRLANQGCAGCHVKFEPLAFAFERYDGLGTYHDRDGFGNSLREDGHVLFPGEEQAVQFRTAAELMQLLADSPRVQESFTWKVAQFSLGRPLDAADAAGIVEIHRESQSQGGTYTSLMTALLTSDLTLMTRTESNLAAP